MDVRCPQCQTLYEIDEDRVQSNDATLKCRECQHLFRLGAGRVPSREDAQRWMVRDSPGGDILYLDSFDTLHKWIVEREIDRSWEISRTGDSWRQIGRIGEFEPIFQAVDSASGAYPTQSGPEEPEGDARAASPEDSGPRPRASTQSQFESVQQNQRAQTPGEGAAKGDASPDEVTTPDADKAAGSGSESDRPAPKDVQLESGRFSGQATDGSEETDEPEDEWSFEGETQPDGEAGLEDSSQPFEEFDDDLGYERSRRWPYVLIVLLLAGAGGYAWYAQPDWLMPYIQEIVPSDEVAKDQTEPPPTKDKTKPEDPASPARESIAEAVAAANEAAGQEASKRVDAATTEVRALRSDAVQAALKVADRQAKRKQKQAAAGGVAGLMKRARDALQNGNASTAEQLFRQVIDRSPGRAEALSGLGWSLIELGRSGEAINFFRRAREASPSLGDAYIGMARAQRNLGRYEEALDTYQEYLSSFPNGPKASIAEYQSEQLRKQLGM